MLGQGFSPSASEENLVTNSNPYAEQQNSTDVNPANIPLTETFVEQQYLNSTGQTPRPGGYVHPGFQQPQQGQPFAPLFQPHVQENPEGRSKATTALILGILSIVFSGTGIPALVMGPLAMSSANKAAALGVNASAGKITGLIGLILGILGTLYWIFVIIVVVIAAASDPTVMY